MKYQVVRTEEPAEALGAYSGYRIRIVARRVAADGSFVADVSYRGSESLPEHAVPLAQTGFATAAEAFEAGYDGAVAWIDQVDGSDGKGWSREG